MSGLHSNWTIKSKRTLCVCAGSVCIILFAMAAWFIWKQNQPVDWVKHITYEELVLDNFEGEYDLLFLTDTHVVTFGEGDSKEIEENAAQRAPGFANAEGASSKQQLADWMEYAVDEQVDGVLLGGDIIDYPSTANLEFLDAQLRKLDMPYLYTMGNHDWTFPWEYMTEVGEQTYRPLLEPYMAGETSLHTWETKDLLVIAVDNSSGQIRPEVIEPYEQLLQTDKPVIVMLHVPLMTQSVLEKANEVWDSPVVLGGGNYGGIHENNDSERFVELTTATDSPVELVLAGHVHFYDKDTIYGDKEVLQIVGDAGFHGSAVRLHIHGNQ